MRDGDGGVDDGTVTRRRLLRGAGLAAGGLTVTAAAGTAGGLAGGPIDTGGDPLPLDSLPSGESHPACEEPSQPWADASDPNERYLQLVARQLELRRTYRPNLDEGAIRSVLRDRQEKFDGHLVFFAMNEFGQPRAFLPETVPDDQTCLETVLDQVHEEKWRARDSALRDVRDQVFEDVQGVHQGLGAVYHEGGSASYDIEFPWNDAYNFMTIRQAVGLVDWVTNAQDPWIDGLRLTY